MHNGDVSPKNYMLQQQQLCVFVHFACISEEKETIFPNKINQAFCVTNKTFILFDIGT
jgi:hypothetical protein